MKNLRTMLATVGMFMLLLVSVSTALAQEQIIFPAGSSAAVVSGNVAAGSNVIYQITASAGQKLHLRLTGPNVVVPDDDPNTPAPPSFSVYPPEPNDPALVGDEQDVVVNLPADNTYTITILGGDTGGDYSLAIAIPPTANECVYLVKQGDTFDSLAANVFNGITADDLVDLNPGSDALAAGSFLIYPCAAAPDPDNDGTGGPTIYRIKDGDTLFSIANRFGTSVAAIQAANGLGSSTFIRIDDELVIPDGSGVIPPGGGTGGPITGGPSTYTIQQGDTLFSIARRFGTTVSAIQAANSLGTSTLIFPGRTLAIPQGAARTTHTVQAGDTLYRIAITYGTTVQTLQQLNGITNPNQISTGQVLIIP